MSKAKTIEDRPDQAEAGPEGEFRPNYHGYTPEQIKKMEDARYDDTAPAPPDDGLDEQRRKNDEQRQRELDEAEKNRQREAEKADKAVADKDKADKKAGWS
jgi:hypothetical protein